MVAEAIRFAHNFPVYARPLTRFGRFALDLAQRSANSAVEIADGTKRAASRSIRLAHKGMTIVVVGACSGGIDVFAPTVKFGRGAFLGWKKNGPPPNLGAYLLVMGVSLAVVAPVGIPYALAGALRGAILGARTDDGILGLLRMKIHQVKQYIESPSCDPTHQSKVKWMKVGYIGRAREAFHRNGVGSNG